MVREEEEKCDVNCKLHKCEDLLADFLYSHQKEFQDVEWISALLKSCAEIFLSYDSDPVDFDEFLQEGFDYFMERKLEKD